jgi:hypothetical protein
VSLETGDDDVDERNGSEGQATPSLKNFNFNVNLTKTILPMASTA